MTRTARHAEFGMRQSSKHTSMDRLVGGVNSPVRAFRAVGAAPIIAEEARGATIVDADGRAWIDCIMGWGALVLGHGPSKVRRAVRDQLSKGWHFGLSHRLEGELAELIAEAIPSVEQVRFTASGTEAAMTAIRLARAATGRTLILSFEGCYHGHSDGLLVKRGSGLATLGLSASAGVPSTVAHETIMVPYNDPPALEQAFAEFSHRIAGAIVEPVAANMGVVVPEVSWLRRLRELTASYGSLLVFDEVVTGFRLGWGGAQELFRIRPDLTILGKIIGGGFPIGALGGSRALMSRLAPEGPVYHAGTFAGHPASMAAGVATLRELRRCEPYAALERRTTRLADGLRTAAARAGRVACVNHAGSMLTLFMRQAPVRNFAETHAFDRAAFSAWANGMRERGVLVPPSPFEAMFLSTAHASSAVNKIIQAATDAFAKLS